MEGHTTLKSPTPIPRLAYSLRDAAAASGLSYSYLKELIAADRLRVTRIGRRVLVSAAELERFLAPA
jgi:excisionase family DNA binding protein